MSRLYHNWHYLKTGLFATISDIFYGDTMSNLMDVNKDVQMLIANVRDYAIIDMTDDVTMTNAQAITQIKAIVNAVAGKTLTIPTSAITSMPLSQIIGMAIGSETINVQLEAGGNVAIVRGNPAGSAYSVSYTEVIIIPGFGVFAASLQYGIAAAASYPAMRTETDTYDVLYTDQAVLVSMDNVAAKSFNFDAANIALMSAGASGKLRMKGAGVVTITASGGATVAGRTTLALNDIVSWYRDGVTNDIIIGYG